MKAIFLNLVLVSIFSNSSFCLSLGEEINGISTQMDPDYYYIESDVDTAGSKQINTKTAVLFVHPTSEFDGPKFASSAIVDLNKHFKNKSEAQSVLFSNISLMKFNPYRTGNFVHQYYISSHQVDVTQHSTNGSHHLIMPNLKNLVMSGGSFLHSLCEATQDAIEGSLMQKDQKSLEIYMPLEAIYGLTVNSIKFRKSHYYRNPLHNTLDEDLKNLGPEKFASYVKQNFFGYSTSNPRGFGKMCPFQNHSLNPLNSANTMIKMTINGKAMTPVGWGPKEIHLHFVHANDLISGKIKLDVGRLLASPLPTDEDYLDRVILHVE